MSSPGGCSPAAVGVLGRDAELGRIEAWLRRGESGGPVSGAAGAVLVIEGEPGIGKTTLWTEAGRRARRAGWDVLSCRPALASSAAVVHRSAVVIATRPNSGASSNRGNAPAGR
jgi:hypothetical protein